jgi:hypothetical protein
MKPILDFMFLNPQNGFERLMEQHALHRPCLLSSYFNPAETQIAVPQGVFVFQP